MLQVGCAASPEPWLRFAASEQATRLSCQPQGCHTVHQARCFAGMLFVTVCNWPAPDYAQARAW